MDETEVSVLCSWKSCMNDGVYYAGPSPKVIRFKQNTKFTTFLDQLFLHTGLDKQRSKFDIICSYPSPVQESKVEYIPLPVVDDTSLKTILDVPSNHPCIENVQVYMEVKSDEVIDLAAFSSKRQRTVISDRIDLEADADIRNGRGGEMDVPVLCYWNGRIKCGCDGVHYEGSTRGLIKVKPKTKLSTLLDLLYRCNWLDVITQRSKVKIFGRYPAVDPQSVVTYLLLPVVNDASLETMLEVPSKHSFIEIVELYLEVNSDGVISPGSCPSPLANPAGSCSKSQKTQHFSSPEGADSFVDTNMTHPPVNLEKDNGWTEDEPNEDIVNGSTRGCGDGDKNSGSGEVEHGINLTGDNGNAHKDSSAAKPRLLSSSWVDDYELGVGLCFKDRDELKKAVEWCSFRGRQKCDLQETRKDEYKIECIRWKCSWSLCAGKMEEHGLVEITKCSGPHTCCPIEPENFTVELAAEEIECLIRVQPTLTVAQLKSWWFEKFGYKLETAEMKAAKLEVVKKLYGDWDQSFRVLPKLMAVLHSSNGLVVDWQYDICPNPEFASFCSVFWAFPQYIEGFHHCKPVIVVDTKDFNNGMYPMKVMIASGFDADDCFFPLAFAVTKEVCVDSWRWFLTGIREKVTQRKGICLISSPHPDILAVINEPGSLWKEPWAFHRFCIDHLSSKFDGVFQNIGLKNLMKQAGSTKHRDEFDSHMETIKKENPEARQWLDQMLPHQWALAHDGGRRYGVIKVHTEALFSVCESLWSLGLPVTAAALLLFDELKLGFQEGLCDSRCRLKRGDMYTTSVLDKLEEFRTASITYVVMPLNNNVFQVRTPIQKDVWIVQLSESMCTCGDFQAYNFPCLHALAVCEKLGLNPLEYVDNCHSVEHFYRTYGATFNHVPEVSAWTEASGVPTLLPPFIPLPSPPTNVSRKSWCKTAPYTAQKSETSPKTYSKRKSPEKPIVEPSKSTSKEKPAGKPQYKTTPCTTQKSDKSPNASSKKKTEKPTKEQSKPASKTEQGFSETLLPPVIPTPPAIVSAKFQCKTTPRTTQKSETSPKTCSKRKSTEKPTVAPSKSTSNEKPAPASPTNLADKSQYKTTPCATQKSDKSPCASSKRKKTEKPTKEQSKPASKTEQARGKKKDKSKELPSDEELRNAIVDILKMVEFDTATITDVIKQLADKFKIDFTQRKTYVKSMINYELAKLAEKSEKKGR